MLAKQHIYKMGPNLTNLLNFGSMSAMWVDFRKWSNHQDDFPDLSHVNHNEAELNV